MLFNLEAFELLELEVKNRGSSDFFPLLRKLRDQITNWEHLAEKKRFGIFWYAAVINLTQ